MKDKKHILMNLCWVLILGVAVASIVYGCAERFGREEWETVLEKATNICFQCIGLG